MNIIPLLSFGCLSPCISCPHKSIREVYPMDCLCLILCIIVDDLTKLIKLGQSCTIIGLLRKDVKEDKISITIEVLYLYYLTHVSALFV